MAWRLACLFASLYCTYISLNCLDFLSTVNNWLLLAYYITNPYKSVFPNLGSGTLKGVAKCFLGGGGHGLYVLRPFLKPFLDPLEQNNKISVCVYVWETGLLGGERSLYILRRNDFTSLKMLFYANSGWLQVIWIL